VKDEICFDDLKRIDYPTWKTIHMMRFPELYSLSPELFDECYGDFTFVAEPMNAAEFEHKSEEIELVDDGANISVTFQNRLEFADLLENYRIHECDLQMKYICQGIAVVIPIDLLTLFTWKQLEVFVCGNASIDIDLLADKTVYDGVQEKDMHIQLFWEILKEFDNPNRQAFLQFVWGRSRLPSSRNGFGKDVFKIMNHAKSLISGNPDIYLPVSHTCFFSLELPRYSSKKIMLEKLTYAMFNCRNIDADTTLESVVNLNMRIDDDDIKE